MDLVVVSGASASNPLGAFLAEFDDVFHDVDDPKVRPAGSRMGRTEAGPRPLADGGASCPIPQTRWTELYSKHRINDAAFRRDMMRALRVIESAAIGDTAIERAFSASDNDNDNQRPV